jgi:hypothetical protein
MALSESGFEIRTILQGLGTAVEEQAVQLEEMLVFEIDRLGLRDSDNLLDSLKQNVRFRDGVPESIGIKFARTGIYVARGARKGFGGTTGSTWRTSKGEKRSTNPESLNKAGTGESKERDWITGPLEVTEKQLGSILEEHYGEATIKVLKP